MDDSWEIEYENKKGQALRFVTAVQHLSRDWQDRGRDGRTLSHPLAGLMSFYRYERVAAVRTALKGNVSPGWMYEHCFGKEEHLGWFADLADALLVDGVEQ